MADDTAVSVLKRKAGAGRPATDAAGMSPGKALRLALAKTAQDSLKMVLVVDAITDQRLSLAEMLDELPDRALLAVLEGPAEGIGLIALSPQMLAALIEVQTMGRVAPGDSVARKPTRTDAALAASFIDRVLQGLETELATEQDVVWAGGFRYASFLDDPRPLGLLMEDTLYRVFDISVDLALGAKKGAMLLVMPADGKGTAPQRPVPAEPDTVGVWLRAMEQTVMTTPAALEAVLHRVTLPLSAVMGLREGELIGLPMAAIDQLVLEGAGGRRLARGKLGQIRGHRAVKLSMEDDTGGGAAVTGRIDVDR